jgi:voltage-gated potassium channel
MQRFMRDPTSVRNAAGVIVTATGIVVIGAGVLMRLLDHEEYKNVYVGMWWALQTVTTVGYGDVTPAHLSGRIVASFVMLEGIAFLAIITATITSAFVSRANADLAAQEARDEAGQEARVAARFDELAERLDRVEAMLRELAAR